jgi:hypothetical protein
VGHKMKTDKEIIERFKEIIAIQRERSKALAEAEIKNDETPKYNYKTTPPDIFTNQYNKFFHRMAHIKKTAEFIDKALWNRDKLYTIWASFTDEDKCKILDVIDLTNKELG